MNPVLFRFGPIVIGSYPALVNLGMILGAGLTFLLARRCRIAPVVLADILLGAAFGALVLARAAYVGVHWDYYARHLRLALQPWDGGLLWHGALVGAALGTAVMCRLREVSVLAALALLTPGAALLSIFVWLASFAVGSAWGLETYPNQPMLWSLSLNLPDLYGIHEPRVPVQLLGAAWSAFLLTTTLVLRSRLRRNGALFFAWLTLHSLGCFALGFLRGDEVPLLLGLRVDQLMELALSIVGGSGLLAAVKLMGASNAGQANQA